LSAHLEHMFCEFQEITSPFKVIWSNVTVIPIQTRSSNSRSP
jgi:hypothetical protein